MAELNDGISTAEVLDKVSFYENLSNEHMPSYKKYSAECLAEFAKSNK